MKKLTVFTLTMASLLVAAALVAMPPPPPSIGVSPSRLEIAVGPGTTMGSTTVLNMSDRPIQVKSSVVSFDLDENNDFRELEPQPGSLAMAMMINPVEFTVPPNGSQTVRFAISTQRLNGAGEHRAMLFFSELVNSTQPGVKFNFRLGMPIYASVGDVEAIAQLNDLKFDPDTRILDLDISSIGSAQVKATGYYLWWPKTEFESNQTALDQAARLAGDPNREPPSQTSGGRLVTKPIFAGTRRSVRMMIQPPPDEYAEYLLVAHVESGPERIQRVIEYVPVSVVDAD